MKNLNEVIDTSCRRIAIAGHVNPDGDCIGSCAALYLYIRKNFPEISADLFLEEPKDSLRGIAGAGEALRGTDGREHYDLFICCDTSTRDRIGVAGTLFDSADRTVCIDHHMSNPGFADINHIEPDASSCSEVLANLMEPERIDREIAEALYTGIIHDCGVFQYQNTSPATMRTAAFLMEKGIDFHGIIDRTFYQRTFRQNRITGFGMMNAALHLGGKCISSIVTKADMDRFGADLRDLDIIVSQLRETEGVLAAVFLYQTDETHFKLSMRSNGDFDSAAAVSRFGGGGHLRAAGATIEGSPEEILKMVLSAVEEQL